MAVLFLVFKGISKEKILANETTGKGSISKIYNSSFSLIPDKQTTQLKSGQKI